MNLRAVIVDDEPLAREMIKEYLADFPDVQVVAECGNGRQAVTVINREKPDLIFLDIQMPGMNGFEVLEHLEALPHIIFSTAYDEFALQAFEVNAIDYLLKPYSRDRFAKAVQRAVQQRALRRNELDRILSLLQASRQRGEYSDRIFVRVGQKIVPVQTQDILWIEAAGDYAQLHTVGQIYVCNMGLGELQKRLDPGRFARVHRSSIIALSALKHLESDGEGGFIATLKDGTRVRVSRSHAAKVRDLIL
jgi:two-component system LytT family response regulator